MLDRYFNWPTFNTCAGYAVRWTPRVVFALTVGYYSLGFAYASGLMELISRVAIKILLPRYGYIGLGLLMPTIQWYAAWAIRFAATVLGALFYDLCKKIVILVYEYLFPSKDSKQSTQRA